MPLSAGTRLGRYEIVAPLGAGGMGEVYRARDSRLGREVAVKVLPQHLSTSPDVRARFEREAKTVSSLNHPNICTLYDVGREGHTDYLVMELVDGETLAERLARGRLPTTEVVKLGAQIADALNRAHRAGIVHRDLKPGNIMLTKSGAKLMDFGLARVTGLAGPIDGSGLSRSALSKSPTMAAPLTAEGTIIGTFLYMAPEQLEGREADSRTDIWALGCVLYETATGRHPFDGRSQAGLIPSIMGAEPPPISRSVATSPPALDELVRTCLAKDPDERWQSAGDLRREMQRLQLAPPVGVPAAGAAATARGRRLATLSAALAAGAVVASVAWSTLAPRPQQPADAVVVDLPTARGGRLTSQPADVVISPNGRWLTYVATDSANVDHLWVRALDSPNARIIPGTDRAHHPFWSPDSRWIAYFTTGEGASLKKVPLTEGQPVKLCDIHWSRGGAWGKHGDILFSPTPASPIQRIDANGGPVTAATQLDSSRHETSHRQPSFLGDGDHFVYVALPAASNRGWTLYLGSLRSRKVKKLGVAMSAATWVEPGYLIYDRDDNCVAQRLDPRRLELVGDVVPLVNTAQRSNEDATRIVTGSVNGRLAMLRADPALRHLQWRDRSGALTGRPTIASASYYGPVLSHDGRRAAITRGIGRFATQAIRVDLERGLATALTDARDYNDATSWSPDDRIIGVSTIRDGGHEEIGLIPADGSGPPRVLPTSALQFKAPETWSPDGRHLVISQISPESGRDLYVVDAASGGTPRPLTADPGSQFLARLSPDGGWLAYTSDETGEFQVFVRRFPDGSDKLQLTTLGGSEPRWTRGGRELMYIGGDRRSFYALAFEAEREPGPNAARFLFRLPYDLDLLRWDVSKDGERILVLAPDAPVREPSTTIIVDWPALLKGR